MRVLMRYTRGENIASKHTKPNTTENVITAKRRRRTSAPRT
jgi:hypothetical protein